MTKRYLGGVLSATKKTLFASGGIWNIIRSNTIASRKLSAVVNRGGQAAFTTPGTYTWVAPEGVTSVSVVCVGGGGGVRAGTSDNSVLNMRAGNGGNLRYVNNIPVVPGTAYTVVVGAGGPVTAPYLGGSSWFNSKSTVLATGGASLQTGGTPSTDTNVGTGGNGGVPPLGDNQNRPGGGGAGGYSGNGGSSVTDYATQSPSGTGGGGGGGGGQYNNPGGYGGGVGIWGEGPSGVGGINGSTGGAGSGGSTNTPGTYDEKFGGGAGAVQFLSDGGRVGAGGAVRIIWGPDRAFPATNTADV